MTSDFTGEEFHRAGGETHAAFPGGCLGEAAEGNVFFLLLGHVLVDGVAFQPLDERMVAMYRAGG